MTENRETRHRSLPTRRRTIVAVAVSLTLVAGLLIGGHATGQTPAAAATATDQQHQTDVRRYRSQHPDSTSAMPASRQPSPTAFPNNAVVAAGDPTGDTYPVSNCFADIDAFAGGYDNGVISVGHSLVCGSDPVNDPSWTDGVTGAEWTIDVNGDGAEDYDVFMLNVGGLVADVTRASDQSSVCSATPNWDGNRIYIASFAASCIGSPASYRMNAFFVYDEAPFSSTCDCPRDWAPDSGYGDTVMPTSSSTSTTTTTTTAPPPPPTFGYHKACDRTDQAPDAFADAGLAADCLKAWGIALGKNDGTFGEEDSLIRSQVSSLLARLLSTNGVSLTTRRTFPDVNPDTVPNSQVRDEIEHLAGAGIIAGFPDGTFGPAGTLSVAQAATFVIRTLHLLHEQRATGPALADQGTTTANYDYAIAQAILNQDARDINGAAYPSASSDATKRGLLADMLAESLEKFGKVYYATCAEAQSAGVAPLTIGDSGYRPALDTDGDGSAC